MTQPVAIPPGATVGLPSGGPAVAGRPYLVQWAATGTSQSLVQRSRRLLWISVRETTGTAAAVVRLLDSTGAGGGIVATLALAAGGSVAYWLGPQGIPCDAGVYLDAVSGSTEGAIAVVPAV